MANPLEGDIEIPKVGKLPKKVIVPLAVGLAGFVAWRFYAARGGASSGEDAGTITDGEFGAVDSAVPDTLNPFPGSFSGGGGTPSGNTDTVTGDRDGDGVIGPGEFTNNGQWTDYVVNKLSAADDWSYSEIVTALGNGLAGRPTTSVQQDILRAAIATGGQPPSGSLTIVGGGNTGLTVAPSSVSVGSVTDSTATINFTAVSGASSYVAYRSGINEPVGASGSSPIRISALKPGTTYSVQVAGLNSAGTPGPKSSAVTVKTTAAAAAGAISGKVTTPSRTSVSTSFKGATGAVRYRVRLDGKLWREVQGSPFTISGLKPNTRYTIGIAAINASGAAGPESSTIIRTKK